MWCSFGFLVSSITCIITSNTPRTETIIHEQVVLLKKILLLGPYYYRAVNFILLSHLYISKIGRHIPPGRQVAVVTKFYNGENICGASVWNLLHIIHAFVIQFCG